VLSAEGSPIDDHRASAAYRAAMLGQALRRLLAQTTAAEVAA
jgi:xanthine dehydrogenase small subunit